MQLLRQLLSAVLAIYIAFPVCCCNAAEQSSTVEGEPMCASCLAESQKDPSPSGDNAPAPCNCSTPDDLVSPEPLQVPAIGYDGDNAIRDWDKITNRGTQLPTVEFLVFRGELDRLRPPGVALRHLNCVLLL